jgi:PAS domain S-box-containing protein
VFPWEARPEGRQFTYVGHQGTELLGFSLDEWSEPDFWIKHIHVDDRQRASDEYSKHLKSSDQFQFEYRMTAKDGRVLWMHDIVNVQRKNAKPTSIRGFMIDVAEQRPSEDTPRLLGGRLIAAQEEERKHIARELHDDLNQRVALISIELEQVGQNLPSSTMVAEQVRGIQKKIEEISTDIHRMSYQLHPSKLDHLGLVPALNSFCRELSESRGMPINFRNEGIPTDLPKNIELCIFRVAQEALQNAVKYSGASQVKVVLKKYANGIKLVASDNGGGFDANSAKFTKGLGFISMKERLRLVNGKLQITSARSKGTRIEATVPLEDRNRNDPKASKKA